MIVLSLFLNTYTLLPATSFSSVLGLDVTHRTRCCEGSDGYPAMVHLPWCTSYTVDVMYKVWRVELTKTNYRLGIRSINRAG